MYIYIYIISIYTCVHTYIAKVSGRPPPCVDAKADPAVKGSLRGDAEGLAPRFAEGGASILHPGLKTVVVAAHRNAPAHRGRGPEPHYIRSGD